MVSAGGMCDLASSPLPSGITCREPARPHREASGCPDLPVPPEVYLVLCSRLGGSCFLSLPRRPETGEATTGFLSISTNEAGELCPTLVEMTFQ